MPPFYTKSDQLLAVELQTLSMSCFSSKTYTHLHQLKPQSSYFCLKGLKNQGAQKGTEEKKMFRSQIFCPSCQYYTKCWYCKIVFLTAAI